MYSCPWCCTNIIVTNKTYERLSTGMLLASSLVSRWWTEPHTVLRRNFKLVPFCAVPDQLSLHRGLLGYPLVRTGIDLGFPIRSTFVSSCPDSAPICWVHVPHPWQSRYSPVPCVCAQNWVFFPFKSVKSFWKLPRNGQIAQNTGDQGEAEYSVLRSTLDSNYYRLTVHFWKTHRFTVLKCVPWRWKEEVDMSERP